MQKPDAPAEPKVGTSGYEVVLSEAELRVLKVLAENAGQSINNLLDEPTRAPC